MRMANYCLVGCTPVLDHGQQKFVHGSFSTQVAGCRNCPSPATAVGVDVSLSRSSASAGQFNAIDLNIRGDCCNNSPLTQQKETNGRKVERKKNGPATTRTQGNYSPFWQQTPHSTERNEWKKSRKKEKPSSDHSHAGKL